MGQMVKVKCPECNGTGRVPTAPPPGNRDVQDYSTCGYCAGRKWIEMELFTESPLKTGQPSNAQQPHQ